MFVCLTLHNAGSPRWRGRADVGTWVTFVYNRNLYRYTSLSFKYLMPTMTELWGSVWKHFMAKKTEAHGHPAICPHSHLATVEPPSQYFCCICVVLSMDPMHFRPPLGCFPHSTQLAWQCPHYDSPWSSDSAPSHICNYYLLMEKGLSATGPCFLAVWDCILKSDGYKGSNDCMKKIHSSCNIVMVSYVFHLAWP